MSDASANQFNHGSNGFQGCLFLRRSLRRVLKCKVEPNRSLLAVAKACWQNKRGLGARYFFQDEELRWGPTFAQGYGAAGSRRYTESGKSADLSAFSVFSALN